MALFPYNNILKISILLVIVLRFILFFQPSFNIDMHGWKAWTERIVTTGASNFYSPTYFSDYFPGFLYMLWAVGTIYTFLFPNLTFNTPLFEIVIKSLTTFFDIGTAYFIYKIIQRYQKSLALFGSLLYLINPAVIFNSSVWGQIDGIFTFFLILGIYFLIEKKNILKSNSWLSITFLIKPQSLAIFPIVVKKIFDSSSFLGAIKKILIIPLIIIFLSFPFFMSHPFTGLMNLGFKASSVYPYNSLFTYNFWSIFGWWKNDSIQFFNLPYQTWGFILYGLMLLIVILPFFIKKIKDQFFYFSSALSFLIFYLFLTRMHERYLFPFFAFILIAALIRKSKVLLGLYVFTSLIHLANLWYVYYYYNYVFLGVEGTNFIYNFLTEYYKVFSIILISTFILLLVIYYRFLFPTLKPKIRIKQAFLGWNSGPKRIKINK